MRLGVAIACLSSEESDGDREKNIELYEGVRTDVDKTLLITDSSAPIFYKDVDAVLETRDCFAPTSGSHEILGNYVSDVQLYCSTSGSTGKSKVAKISRLQMLHEVSCYPILSQDVGFDLGGQENKVYCPFSTLWGASFFGVLTIAVAFRASISFGDQETTSHCRSGANIFCLVPSVLDQLPKGALPSKSLVFSWGEALPDSLAKKFCDVTLVNLLIATEFWLSFYQHNGKGFKVIRGVETKLDIVTEEDDSVGNLYVSGPSVFLGYTDQEVTKSSFVVQDGVRWYKTGDQVEPLVQEKGFVYKGRMGNKIKVKGKFVDLLEVDAVLDTAITKITCDVVKIKKIKNMHVCAQIIF